MSNLHDVFPIGHRVFQGGRYIRAFDHLPDIDHFEHSILTYLGSLMPFNKSFTDHPAFPSVATIANSTKISTATVRNRLKSLQKKGYVHVKEVRFLNARGHFQQSSNDYFLCYSAFQFFDDVIQSRERIGNVMKRAVGESFSYAVAEPSSSSDIVGFYEAEQQALSTVVPNSPLETPKDDPSESGSSNHRDLFSMKREVDNIVQAWEELVKVPVSKGEKAKFLREFVRIGGNETYFMEKLLPIASDPYLASRAGSINFLFSGIDCAIRNREEIVRTASRALDRVDTSHELDDLLREIPEFIKAKSQNFGVVTDVIVKHLLQDPINTAKSRVGAVPEQFLPRNSGELRSQIKQLIQAGVSEQQLLELEIIESAISNMTFGRCLELFSRFCQKHPKVEEVQ